MVPPLVASQEIHTYIIHNYIHTYMHTYVHTYLLTYLLTFITLHYITFHYITCHYITLHTLHTYVRKAYVNRTYIHTYRRTYKHTHTHQTRVDLSRGPSGTESPNMHLDYLCIYICIYVTMVTTSCGLYAPRCVTTVPQVRFHGSRGGVFIDHRTPPGPRWPPALKYNIIYNIMKDERSSWERLSAGFFQ